MPDPGRVLVAVPCLEKMHPRMVESLVYAIATTSADARLCILTGEVSLGRARNTLAALFLRDPALTHLMMWDADIEVVQPVPGRVSIIDHLAGRDVPFVGGVYGARKGGMVKPAYTPESAGFF